MRCSHVSPHPSSVTAPRQLLMGLCLIDRKQALKVVSVHTASGRGRGMLLGEESEGMQKPPYFMVGSGEEQDNADGCNKAFTRKRHHSLGLRFAQLVG